MNKKKEFLKKIVSVPLAAAMICSAAVFAESAGVTVPGLGGITTSAAQVFGDYEYNINNGSVTITKYTGSAATLTIPSTIGGYTVKGIGDYAFQNNNTITSLTIPNSVEKIGYRSFENCSKLKTLNLSNKITSVDRYAFRGCSSLESVTIPSGVTVIGEYMFDGCSSIEELTIPGTVTTIGERAFQNCTSIDAITIPDSVTSIGESAFYNCINAASLTIGTGVTSIGDYAFQSCVRLPSVTIPNNVQKIGYKSFKDCTRVSSVKIGSGVTSVDNCAFQGCIAVKNITIVSGASVIGNYMFDGCTSLASVSIPNTVKTIGERAFQNCSSLEVISIPNSVTSIGEAAFYNCKNASSLSLGSGVTSIGEYAFESCIKLPSVTIPDSVLSIGYKSFSGCTAITSVKIGAKVETVDYYSFNDCTSLKTVTISSGASVIGGYMFSGCTNLTSVSIPSTVKSIGERAFQNTSLGTITIPDSVKTVGEAAFYNCQKASKITIGKKVTSIGDYAFMDCVLITDINIPDSVSSIGYKAFSGCTKLTNVKIGNFLDSMGSYAFSDCKALKTVEIADGSTRVGDEAFYNCSALTSIYIPESVIYIGSKKLNDEDLTDGYVFYNHSASLTIYGKKNSFAHKFATANGIPFSDNYNPTIAATGISLDKTSATVNKGSNITLTATVTPSNATNKTVTWTSSNTSVATVSGGVVKAVAAGTATITAKTSNGITATCKISVPAPSNVLSLNNVVFSAYSIDLGESITINCGAVNGTKPYTYAANYSLDGGSVVTIRDYSDAAKIKFTPSKAGSYKVTVKVKDASGKVASKSYDVLVTSKSYTLSSLSKVSASTIQLGDKVKLTAKAKGGTGFYKYSFYQRKSGATDWKTIRAYGAEPTEYFKPASAVKYEIMIKVKDNNGKVVKSVFNLNVTASDKKIHLSALLNKTVIYAGEALHVKAIGTGGTGYYKYGFYFKKKTDSEWTTAKAFSASNEAVFTLPQTGSYQVCVKVKDSNGATTKNYYDVTSYITTTAIKNNSTVSASTITLGSSVKMTASCTGGTGCFEYSMLYRISGDEEWSIIQSFGKNTTVNFKPEAKGKYELNIKVTDSEGSQSEKYFNLTVN